MKRRSLSRVLAGAATVLGLAAIFGAGCGGGGAGGEFSSLCQLQCNSWNDCEDYTKIVVTIDDCLSHCDTNADNVEAAAVKKCKDYEIVVASLDGCRTSLQKTDQACLDKSKSDYDTYVKFASQDCGFKLISPELNPDAFVNDYVRCP